MGDKCVKGNGQFDPVADKDLVATCSECGGFFHANCCAQKTWSAWAKRNAKRSEWKCDSCRVESSSTHSKSDNEATSASGNDAVLRAIQGLRDEIASNHRESKDRFDGLELSLRTLSESVEDSKRRIQGLEEENASLKEEVQKNKNLVCRNREEIEQLQLEVYELQQYSRRNNLEIKGVPYTHGENVYTILECVARALGVQWHVGHVSTAHRLQRPASGAPASIIVAFVCRSTKERWLGAARGKKLKTTDLAPNLTPGPVYVNSHLTVHNKQLLGRARQLVRERKLANAWTVDEKVLVRKMSGGLGIRVHKLEDLDNVIQ